MEWSSEESSGIFCSHNSTVVEIVRRSKCEMSFVGPYHVTQPICHRLKLPHSKFSPLHKIAWQKFMMTLNFVRVAQAPAVVLPKQERHYETPENQMIPRALPMLRQIRYNLHFFLNCSSSISTCAQSDTTRPIV